MNPRPAHIVAASFLSVALASCGPRPTQPVAAGAAPEADAGGPACESDGECPAGEVCTGGTCSPYEGDVGDPCWADLDCALALRCLAGSCSATIAPDPGP
mgnify:CR=1 FL=1